MSIFLIIFNKILIFLFFIKFLLFLNIFIFKFHKLDMRNEFSINLEIKDMMKQFHKYKYKNRSTIH